MKNITMADVAEHAKTSKSTVSQYLNKRYEYMSENTRKRIEAAIEELNYHPNSVARSLKQKATYTVGVIVANILHSFSTHIIRTLETEFNKQGFHTIICNADDDPEKERNYIEMLLAKQVDGLIIFPTGENLDLYEQMKDRGFPIVFMDRKVDAQAIDTIMLDNHKAAELAVDRLTAGNYRKISIITTSVIRNISPRIERIEGYRQALQQHGLPIRKDYIKTADAEHLRDVLVELFEMDAPPEAILAANDIVLVEVLKYIKEKNLSIPDDIAVIGIDEVPFAAFFTPPITIVEQPKNEMANLAAELLLKKINGQKEGGRPTVHRMQPNLIDRHSC
ncbi:LacI family DNA-binding transcriptional regulator [Planomicrobium okeanokoites]|uniref:LacI family DNA-binding transcriptional regulator n=1 Tax=Planomicrobium okeanokoites TaxID=244 RepID=UPI000A031942|nr:substrate-binding domain-containing protein [Planomicrobium okeanokoites]